MKMTRTQNGTALEIALEGRLDTTTAPELEKELGGLNDVTTLTLDYDADAGLQQAGVHLLGGPAGAAVGPQDHEPQGRHEGDPRERDRERGLRGDRLRGYPHHRIRRSEP